MRVESEDLFAGSAFAEDEDGDIGACDERGLLLELTHPLGGANKRLILAEGNFLWNVGLGLDLGQGEVFFDGGLDVGGDEGLEDDALDPQPDDDLDVLKLGGEGEDDDGNAGPGRANVREKGGGVPARVEGDEEQVRLLGLFQAIDEVLFFGEEAKCVLARESRAEVFQDGQVRFKNGDARLGLD